MADRRIIVCASGEYVAPGRGSIVCGQSDCEEYDEKEAIEKFGEPLLREWGWTPEKEEDEDANDK